MLFIKGEVLYTVKWEKNYSSKLHTMMTHIIMSWFKESTERRKLGFLKETVENANLHKVALNKAMATQE